MWADVGGQQGGCLNLTSSEEEERLINEKKSNLIIFHLFHIDLTFTSTHTQTHTLKGEDSAGADSGRLRGGTGGGMEMSSQPRLKLIMEETEDDPGRTKQTHNLPAASHQHGN